MESRIPLPTDNIFKFYALFGLLLIIFGSGSILYVSKTTNDLIFESFVEYELLKADPARTFPQEARFQILKIKREVAKSDKKFLLNVIGGIIGIGICMVVYGFRKWHKEIQPIQDEMARLNLEKLRREVGEENGT